MRQKGKNIKSIPLSMRKIIWGTMAALLMAVLIEWVISGDFTAPLRHAAVFTQDSAQMERLDDGSIILTGVNTKVDSVTVYYNEDGSLDASSVQVFYTADSSEDPADASHEIAKECAGSGFVRFRLYEHVSSLHIAAADSSTEANILKIAVNEFSFRTYLLPFHHSSVGRVVIYWVLGTLAAMIILFGLRKTLETAYQYRFWIGIIIIAIFTLAKVNGSSIAAYAGYLPGYSGSTSLGEARLIRSDEWGVFTPMMISQKQTGYAYFSDLYRGTLTDMAIVYGQPILGVITLFRPFLLMFLAAGTEYGIAFFWIARLVALFLVTFEFGMLITDRDKRLSLVLALGTAFAPFVQWWFAVNGTAELFIFVELAVILFDRYMKTEYTQRITKLIYALLIAWCAGSFILILYPAWQIPMLYILLMLVIWVVVRNRKQFRFTRNDAVNLAAALLVLAGLGAYIWHMSSGTISLVANTVYPGARAETGGGLSFFTTLFKSWGSIFLPYTDEIGNQCETALFFDLFPAGILLSVYGMWKTKKKDLLSVLLLCLTAVFLSYILIGWPVWLAKVTLLSKTTAYRLLQITGFLQLILLIRAIAYLKETSPGKLFKAVLTACAVLICCCACRFYTGLGSFYYILMCVSAVSGCLILCGVPKRGFKNAFVVWMLVLSVSAGATVNPVQTGTSAITDSPVPKAIRAINSEDEGTWAVIQSIQVLSNVPPMVGASTVNSTNTYPNMQIWKILDPSGEHAYMYNRYLHLEIRVSHEAEPRYELVQADYLRLWLSLADLKKINVKYLMSTSDLSTFSNTSDKLTLLYRYGYCYIYKLS